MSDTKRPSAERLLHILEKQERERQAGRGKLKIFLGYAAGVGKTYRMLQKALVERDAGTDIVVGLVETHGRSDIIELLKTFEALPLVRVRHHGIEVEELDVDKVLKRKPHVVLVDELAHTNSGGGRHRKRWQDVEEILAAGIDVFTTLNVQHIEGLHDLVKQITGIDVQETLPDRIVEEAAEIELVDIAPEELRERLRRGKVYISEQAKEATAHFFTERNLLSLRELAMRYASRRVSDTVGKYLEEHEVKGSWDSSSRIMVCIGANPRSGKLLRVGRRLAQALNAEWYAAHIELLSATERSVEEKVMLEQHINLARELGATIIRQSGFSVADEIAEAARTKNVSLVIVGGRRRSWWRRLLMMSESDAILLKTRNAQVLTIDDENAALPPLDASTRLRKKKNQITPFSLAIGGLGLAAATGACLLVREYLNPLNMAMIYLLFAAISSIIGNLRAGILFSILSVAIFNFFFIPPYNSLSIHNLEYIPSFAIMFLVSITINFLTEIIKRQVEQSKEREAFMGHLYDFSSTLLKAQTFGDVLESALRGINAVFDCDALFLLPDRDGELRHVYAVNEARRCSEREIGVATWAFRNRQPAGLGTDTLSGDAWHHLPLTVGGQSLGVLSIAPHSGTFTKEQRRLLQSYTNIISLALLHSRMVPMPDFQIA
jgi:two-component system, OmpR family, sensor histidine kinase KdpD